MDSVEDKWIPFPDLPEYLISATGVIKGKNGNLLVGHTDDAGYQRVNMSLGKRGKIRKVRVHRAVAQVFLPNPSNLPIVNHINGIRNDNRVENLEWTSSKQNSKRQVFPRASSSRYRKIVQLTKDGELVKVWDSLTEAAEGQHKALQKISACCTGKSKTSMGFRWMHYDNWKGSLPGEIWKDLELNEISAVSSEGRFRTRKQGRLTRGYINGGYLRIGSGSAHRIVAEIFCPKLAECDVVNHRNGIKTDNRAINLEWTTHSENTKHAIANGLMTHRRRPVKRVYPDGTCIEYPSVSEAIRVTGLAGIHHACTGKLRHYCGCEWSFIEIVEFTLDDVYSPVKKEETINDDDPIWAELGL